MSRNATEVYWESFLHSSFQDQPLYLAATERGLCAITLPNESFATLRAWAERKIGNAVLIQAPERMSAYVRQLREYLDGERTAFELPFDLRGTDFQMAVWEALTRIPFGQTRSYSELAGAVGHPKAVRAVGAANGANPVPIVIPCHRVIGKNDALTGFRGGLKVKEELLRLEGFHAFNKNGHARFRF
ncbi:methylated-DNA--[protein]-cysteine S-methyltransferase [Paenibacillus glycinis]|nr:methylated-DNA--[protein]-cysteine S-methyltransferase [Paenibacillus glycinis]